MDLRRLYAGSGFLDFDDDLFDTGAAGSDTSRNYSSMLHSSMLWSSISAAAPYSPVCAASTPPRLPSSRVFHDFDGDDFDGYDTTSYVFSTKLRSKAVGVGFYVMAVLFFMTHACALDRYRIFRPILSRSTCCWALYYTSSLHWNELGIRSCLRMMNVLPNSAITGLMLLTLLTVYLLQCRSADSVQYFLRPPACWLINLTFFWTDDGCVPAEPLYPREWVQSLEESRVVRSLRHDRAHLLDARVCAGQASAFQANIVEEYVLLSALHSSSWDWSELVIWSCPLGWWAACWTWSPRTCLLLTFITTTSSSAAVQIQSSISWDSHWRFFMAVLTFMTHACALDRPRISGQHCRGVCVAERLLLILVGWSVLGIGSCPLSLMSSQLNLVTTGLLCSQSWPFTSSSAAVQILSSTSWDRHRRSFADGPVGWSTWRSYDQRRDYSYGAIIDIHANEFKVLKNPRVVRSLRNDRTHLHDACVSDGPSSRCPFLLNLEEASASYRVLRVPYFLGDLTFTSLPVYVILRHQVRQSCRGGDFWVQLCRPQVLTDMGSSQRQDLLRLEVNHNPWAWRQQVESWPGHEATSSC